MSCAKWQRDYSVIIIIGMRLNEVKVEVKVKKNIPKLGEVAFPQPQP
jgi:hypothetical protein